MFYQSLGGSAFLYHFFQFFQGLVPTIKDHHLALFQLGEFLLEIVQVVFEGEFIRDVILVFETFFDDGGDFFEINHLKVEVGFEGFGQTGFAGKVGALNHLKMNKIINKI